MKKTQMLKEITSKQIVLSATCRLVKLPTAFFKASLPARGVAASSDSRRFACTSPLG